MTATTKRYAGAPPASLQDFLTRKAEELHPADNGFTVDTREYAEHLSPDAIDGEAWLHNRTSYIWRVGVLAQVDSNKCDHAMLFIGHERHAGYYEFIGVLHWSDGENDDVARVLPRYMDAVRKLHHPLFAPDRSEAVDLAERVSGEAYQIISSLAEQAASENNPEVVRALNYFSRNEWREGTEILPWG